MSFVFRLPLVHTVMRPELVRPAFEVFRQVNWENLDLSNHKEVNFLILREPFEVVAIFLKNKIN